MGRGAAEALASRRAGTRACLISMLGCRRCWHVWCMGCLYGYRLLAPPLAVSLSLCRRPQLCRTTATASLTPLLQPRYSLVLSLFLSLGPARRRRCSRPCTMPAPTSTTPLLNACALARPSSCSLARAHGELEPRRRAACSHAASRPCAASRTHLACCAPDVAVLDTSRVSKHASDACALPSSSSASRFAAPAPHLCASEPLHSHVSAPKSECFCPHACVRERASLPLHFVLMGKCAFEAAGE